MTRDEQKTFVKDLTKNIRDEVLNHVQSGEIPAEWDGHELREYLALKFNDARSRTLRETPARRRAYNNIIKVTNL